MTELIGWIATALLLATLGRQVYTQWREGATQGVSHWLFIGQLAASSCFLIYSWLLDNWVFVVSNAMLIVTAAVGQIIYRRNRRREEHKQAAPAGGATASPSARAANVR